MAAAARCVFVLSLSEAFPQKYFFFGCFPAHGARFFAKPVTFLQPELCFFHA
jgi:hypothetical protein